MEHSALNPRDEGRTKGGLLLLILTGKRLGSEHGLRCVISTCAVGHPQFLGSFLGLHPTGTAQIRS